LLPAEESNEAQKGLEARDLRNYLENLTKGSGLPDLQFRMMLGLLDAGYVEAVRRLFAAVAERVCNDREDLLLDETASQLMYDDWVGMLSEEEIKECNRAYDRSYPSLSKDEKEFLKKSKDVEVWRRRVFSGKT